MKPWIMTTWQELAAVAFSSLVMYALLIVFNRVSGLRSFSKMSGFDFAITVAFGSILAGVILTKDPSLLLGVFGLGVLFGMQKLLAVMRRRFEWAESLLDNKPLILVYEGEFFEENMNAAQITRCDIVAKLREANVIRMEQVRAVVLESTGDVSVLHSDSPEDRLEQDLLEGVVWGERSREAFSAQANMA